LSALKYEFNNKKMHKNNLKKLFTKLIHLQEKENKEIKYIYSTQKIYFDLLTNYQELRLILDTMIKIFVPKPVTKYNQYPNIL